MHWYKGAEWRVNMASTFFGLSISYKGLQAAQTSITTLTPEPIVPYVEYVLKASDACKSTLCLVYPSVLILERLCAVVVIDVFAA